MLKNLPQGIKISITRSITTVFEQYMAKIGWNEDEYDMTDFMQEWRTYINNTASWFDNVSDEMKAHPSFHDELAAKINETIQKNLMEEPSQEQIDELEKLQKISGENYDYSCKAEAKYLIGYLTEKVKKG